MALSSNLSPKAASRVLSPLKSSLETLHLVEDESHWPGHDMTQLDLSGFKVLSKINVPSTCFFKNLTYGVKRRGLYKLFPHSLVELRVSVAPTPRLFRFVIGTC
jgi:hypothetical protein